MATLYVFAFLLGLCVGSFLNVCVYRLPRGMSLLRPASHCPFCDEPILWHDNIPVIGWLKLRGLCRSCGVLISPRYMLVELLTGVVFLWIFAVHRAAPADTVLAGVEALAAYSLLAAALIAASFVDIERMIIPDEISIGGMYIAPIACLFFPAIIPHDTYLTLWLLERAGLAHSAHLAGFTASILGMGIGAAVVYFAGLLGRSLFRKEAMGFGDVKLMAMVGAFIGWQWVVLAFFTGCVLGAVVGVALLIRRRDTHIPFGPYLAGGSIIAMLHGDAVWHVFWNFPLIIRGWF